jgi:hypothetical protein
MRILTFADPDTPIGAAILLTEHRHNQSGDRFTDSAKVVPISRGNWGREIGTGALIMESGPDGDSCILVTIHRLNVPRWHSW